MKKLWILIFAVIYTFDFIPNKNPSVLLRIERVREFDARDEARAMIANLPVGWHECEIDLDDARVQGFCSVHRVRGPVKRHSWEKK